MTAPKWLGTAGEVLKWVTLLGLAGTAISFARDAVDGLSGIEGELTGIRTTQAAFDSAQSKAHFDMWLEICVLQGFDTAQELRGCIR